MPYREYIVLRRAAEINIIEDRISNIIDISAAFSNPKERVESLQKELASLRSNSTTSTDKPTKNWQAQLSRFKR
jgi:hypothetical protein